MFYVKRKKIVLKWGLARILAFFIFIWKKSIKGGHVAVFPMFRILGSTILFLIYLFWQDLFAFWLRSSVVSVLFSVTAEISLCFRIDCYCYIIFVKFESYRLWFRFIWLFHLGVGVVTLALLLVSDALLPLV